MTKYIYTLIFLTLLILPILAPILLHFKLDFAANVLYTFFQWFCHQRTWRSYHIFDYQIAYCAREVGLFIGLTISSFVVTKIKFYENNTKRIIIVVLLSLIPMAIDGGIQAFAEIRSIMDNILPFYESVNLLRSLTGIVLGVGLGTTLIPFLNSPSNNKKIKALNKSYYIIIFGVSILVLMFINAFAYFSSSVYKPSHLLIDIDQRYPGVNYEISSNGGHTGGLNFRIISEDKSRYCDIAKKSNVLIYEKFCKN